MKLIKCSFFKNEAEMCFSCKILRYISLGSLSKEKKNQHEICVISHNSLETLNT